MPGPSFIDTPVLELSLSGQFLCEAGGDRSNEVGFNSDDSDDSASQGNFSSRASTDIDAAIESPISASFEYKLVDPVLTVKVKKSPQCG
jgi:hypothetical protein